MYLPFTSALIASSAFSGSLLDVANCTMSDEWASVSSPSLVARQDTIPPPPPSAIPQSTSFVLITSVATSFATATPIATSAPSSRVPEPTSLPPPPPIPKTTLSTEIHSTQLVITIVTSVSVSTLSTIPTSTSIASTTSESTSTSLPTAAHSSQPSSGPDPWINKGKIAGTVVGSVLGLIILGILIYTLFAASRGINVCNCFGGCCGNHEEDEEKDRPPSRSSDTHPYPGAANPGPGTGYYRGTRPMSHEATAPLPLMLPQQVAQDHRNGCLQHNP